MNCEDCNYADIADWEEDEEDEKQWKAKAIYWCEKYKKLCSNISECQYKAESEE